MNEKFLITKEMFDNFDYDENMDAKHMKREMNDLKRNPTLFEHTYVLPSISRDNAVELIKIHLNELSKIESNQNCIPLYVAKRNIEMGLRLIHKLTDGHVHHQHSNNHQNDEAMITATSEISLFVIIRSLLNSIESEWSKINILFDSPREQLFHVLMENIFKSKITKKIVDDNNLILHRHEKRMSFCSMFILQLSDLDGATHHLIESIDDPTSPWKIGYIYVQESCYDEFIMKLKQKLRPYPNDMLCDKTFIHDYNEIQKKLEQLKAQKIVNEQQQQQQNEILPIICYEFDREFFDNGTKFSPIIIVKAFRTIKEATNLAKNDKAHAATIWSSNYSAAYEIAVNLNYSLIWINCYGIIDLGIPIRIVDLCKTDGKAYKDVYGKSGVLIKNSYHFEYFLCNGDKMNEDEYYKTIIFPIGVTFAN